MTHCMVDPDEAYEERRDNEAGFNDWPQDTWRSMEKDPPELNTPVLVTDGESVFFGRTEKYDDSPHTAFHGVNVEDGFTDSFWSDEPEEWEKLQWQPAPGYQKQKTADEMFAELGVYKTGEAEQNIRYESGNILIYVNKKTKAMEFCCIDGVEPGIILACARLIEEMEAEK